MYSIDCIDEPYYVAIQYLNKNKIQKKKKIILKWFFVFDGKQSIENHIICDDNKIINKNAEYFVKFMHFARLVIGRDYN